MRLPSLANEDELGCIIRWDSVVTPGRVYYSAAGRCVAWDGMEYWVTITPPDINVNCWPGYDTEQEAREAIRTWEPSWPNHARDRKRALKETV